MSAARILLVAGTRPEAIKLAPLALAMRARPDRFRVELVATGQQRELLSQALAEFDLTPDHDLDVMRPDQPLASLTARLLDGLDPVIAAARPDWVLVQGDTTSAMAGALAAYYRRVRVGHVEAGLRTHDRFAPYPEEVNRRVIASVAELHFAVTSAGRDNLLNEGVGEGSIHVVGNTGIDALLWMRDRARAGASCLPNELRAALSGRRLIVVTAHRRESFGEGLEEICLALRAIADRHPDVLIVCPVHLNPTVREPMRRLLSGHERILLPEPLAYRPFVELMDRAEFVMTDSGGIQEEAPSLGQPVLVLREKTERPEGVAAGNAWLVGTARERIESAAARLLEDAGFHRGMAGAENPYGDGHAAERIARIIGRQEMDRRLAIGDRW